MTGAISAFGIDTAMGDSRKIARGPEDPAAMTWSVSGPPPGLFGRKAEWERLRSVLRSVYLGQGGTVTIHGVCGVGKTRLIEELAAAAGLVGFEVVHACPPELTESDQPLLVAIDDLHLWPPAHLSLLQVLLDDVGRRAVTLVATQVPDLVGGAVPLAPGHVIANIGLLPLTEQAAEGFARDLIGAAPDPRLRAALATAEGNPRLLIELVRGLREEGALIVGDGSAGLLNYVLPARVVAFIRTRLSELSPQCRQMLQVGAVIGRSFRAEAVANILQSTVATFLQSSEEALRSGLVAAENETFRYVNDLMWQAVLRSIAPPTLQLIRREAACKRPFARSEESWAGDRMGACTNGDHSLNIDITAASAGYASDTALTTGQFAIARLVAEGLTNRQIASRVYLSPHTVNYHLRQIFRKLDVSARAELASTVRSWDAVYQIEHERLRQ